MSYDDSITNPKIDGSKITSTWMNNMQVAVGSSGGPPVIPAIVAIPCSYIIYKSGSTYYAKNGNTGATTSNANVDTLITACIAAGGKHFYLKNGITWAIVGDMVPAHITVVGEDWDQVILEPATNPLVTTLKLGHQAQVYYVTIHHFEAAIGAHGDYPSRMLINNTAATDINISNYAHEGLLVETGEAGVDMPGIGVNQHGPGDGLWSGVTATMPDKGVGLNVWVDYANAAGQCLGVTVYLFGAGYGYWGLAEGGATGTIMLLANEATASVLPLKIYELVDTTTDMMILSNFKTAGDMINMYQGTTTFTGHGIYMNLGANAGSFTGKFLDLLNNSNERFWIGPNGETYISNKITTGDMINLYNDSAAATAANGILINMHCGAGAYTGYPISVLNNSNQRFYVDADGSVGVANVLDAGPMINLYNNSANANTPTGILMNLGAGVGAYTGNFINCTVALASKFTVAYDGDTRVYGTFQADGVSTLNGKVEMGADVDLNGNYIDGLPTAAAPSGGVEGYLKVKIGGAAKRVPYYADV